MATFTLRGSNWVVVESSVDLLCSCDLDLDQITFICELDPQRYTRCVNMNFYVKAFKSYRQTDKHTYTTEIIYQAASRVVKDKGRHSQRTPDCYMTHYTFIYLFNLSDHSMK